MGTPQIIFIVLLGLNLGVGLAQHGTPKTGNNSFMSAFLGTIIQVGLLYWGGFFG